MQPIAENNSMYVYKEARQASLSIMQNYNSDSVLENKNE